MKINVDYFEKPVAKSYKELQAGDIIKFEYGDYDNWVTAYVESVTVESDERWSRIEFRYVNNPDRVDVANHMNTRHGHDFDVIGVGRVMQTVTFGDVPAAGRFWLESKIYLKVKMTEGLQGEVSDDEGYAINIDTGDLEYINYETNVDVEVE